LRPLALTEREQRFGEEFPGLTARFTDGEREYVIRWVMGETRKLHPAADCLASVGYSVHPLPIRLDPTGNRWGSFEAVRGGERMLVQERIYDGAGNSWTDVSSWYWSALLGDSAGPYWAITVAENQPQ
jgi:hypothetical protein